MQATNLQAAAAGLLSQLLSAGFGEGAAASPTCEQAPQFFETMGHQIRDLLSRSGVDRETLDALDDQALAAGFLALLQGVPPPVEPESSSTQTAVAMLRSVLESSGLDASLETTPDTDSDGGQSADWVELPCYLLEQLSAANQVLDAVARERPLAAAVRASPGALESAQAVSGGSAPTLDASGALGRDGVAASLFVESPLPGEGAASGARRLGETLLGAASQAGSAAAVGSEPASPDRTAIGPTEGRALFLGLEHARREPVEVAAGAVSLQSASGAGAALGSGASETQPGAKVPESLDLTRLLQSGGELRLAEMIRRHAGAGLETVELRLHPPSLGALDVRVTLENDRAHVQFVTAHPIVKEVLEAAIPRLREALDRQGLPLGDVSVFGQAAGGEQAPQRGTAFFTQGPQELDALGEAVVEETELASVTLSTLARRLDYFV